MQRRKQLIHQSVERKAVISKCYKQKHPEVYVLQVGGMFGICFAPNEFPHGLF